MRSNIHYMHLSASIVLLELHEWTSFNIQGLCYCSMYAFYDSQKSMHVSRMVP